MASTLLSLPPGGGGVRRHYIIHPPSDVGVAPVTFKMTARLLIKIEFKNIKQELF